MNHTIFICILGTLICSSSYADSGSQHNTKNPSVGISMGSTSGQVLYNSLCASCHGKKMDGKGPLARAVIPAPPNLTEHAKEHNVMELMQPIMHGEESMPAWRYILSHDEAFEIVKHIRSKAENSKPHSE